MAPRAGSLGALSGPGTSLRVGVVSDTHGLLRLEARAFLAGCDYIVHGGDVGGQEILAELAAMAPLIAVRGNNDDAPWAACLPEAELIRVGSVFFYIIHRLSDLPIDLDAAAIGVVISGHSHQPSIDERDGILYVNPGSCGPRRFKLPVTAAEIKVSGSRVTARTIDLVPHPAPAPKRRATLGKRRRSRV